MLMNAVAVWTDNSNGTLSPPDDDCDRMSIAFAEISITRIFGGPISGIILVLGSSFKL